MGCTSSQTPSTSRDTYVKRRQEPKKNAFYKNTALSSTVQLERPISELVTSSSDLTTPQMPSQMASYRYNSKFWSVYDYSTVTAITDNSLLHISMSADGSTLRVEDHCVDESILQDVISYHLSSYDNPIAIAPQCTCVPDHASTVSSFTTEPVATKSCLSRSTVPKYLSSTVAVPASIEATTSNRVYDHYHPYHHNHHHLTGKAEQWKCSTNLKNGVKKSLSAYDNGAKAKYGCFSEIARKTIFTNAADMNETFYEQYDAAGDSSLMDDNDMPVSEGEAGSHVNFDSQETRRKFKLLRCAHGSLLDIRKRASPHSHITWRLVRQSSRTTFDKNSLLQESLTSSSSTNSDLSCNYDGEVSNELQCVAKFSMGSYETFSGITDQPLD